jgi:hypothetical protein
MKRLYFIIGYSIEYDKNHLCKISDNHILEVIRSNNANEALATAKKIIANRNTKNKHFKIKYIK